MSISTNSKRYVAALAAIGVACLTAPALATGLTYSVAVGGDSAPGTHPASLVADPIVSPPTARRAEFRIRNNSGAIIKMGCTAPSSSGVVRSGPGAGILDITSSAWNGCTGPLGAFLPTQVGTWTFHGNNPATASNDVIAGHVDNVRLRVSTPTGICTFEIAGNATGTVAGKLSATFDESTQKLAINESNFTGNLYAHNVVGCLGQWQNGNRVDITGFTPSTGSTSLPATFTLSVPDGPVNLISSP